jgi:hypothetical protein
MFSRVRIVRVSTGYVPQIKDGLFSPWYSVGKLRQVEVYSLESQLAFCSYSTEKEAKEAVDKFIKKRKELIRDLKKLKG